MDMIIAATIAEIVIKGVNPNAISLIGSWRKVNGNRKK
jgi:hypothetical protein